MNIFIDTNIYLSFYHFSSDNLDELNKLVLLLKQKKLKIFLPFQVILEFRRNREDKIDDAMKTFGGQKLDFPFPQFCKDYTEFKTLRELQKAYSKCHSELIDKVYSDIQKKNLKADILFDEIIKFSKVIKISDTIYSDAKKRMEIGNPPGKNRSIGDAINWETLLRSVSDREDIYFISDDIDYASSINRDSFNAFLSDEWSLTKSSQLFFYRRLSSFFKEHFPDILLEDLLEENLEKDKLIQSLGYSNNFAYTHMLIAQLNIYSDFTRGQVREIVSGYLNNNQVNWIIKDPDIHDFIEKIYESYKEYIDPVSLESPPDHEPEIPF